MKRGVAALKTKLKGEGKKANGERLKAKGGINFSGKNLWNAAELLSKTKFEAGKVGRWEAEWDMQPTTNN